MTHRRCGDMALLLVSFAVLTTLTAVTGQDNTTDASMTVIVTTMAPTTLNDSDPCDPNPCGNSGNCTSSENGTATCKCPIPYTGDACETADSCLSNPCMDGATCLPSSNGLTHGCLCPDETLAPCEETEECSVNPCENGGTCMELVGDYKCNCVDNWTEKNCTVYIAEVFEVTGNTSVELGGMLELKCMAHGFPLPINITWYFNNILLTEDGNSSRIMIDEDLNSTMFTPPEIASILVVDDVVYEDGGNYTCRATNSYSQDDSPSEISVEIEVFSLPMIIEGLPETIELAEGETMFLNCTASGIPLPEMSWYEGNKKVLDNATDHRVTTILSENDPDDPFTVMSSLTITNISYQLSGDFSCRATNPHDKDESETILNVLVGAIISEAPMSKTEKISETVTFICTALGNPTPHVEWYKSTGSKIITDGSKYYIEDIFGNDNLYGKSLNSTLTINDITRMDAGSYYCNASNELNSELENFNLTVLETPGSPMITLTALSRSEIRVDWTGPEGDDAGNPPYENCTVEYNKTSNEARTVLGTYSSSETTKVIDGLDTYEEYQVVVFCTNEVGSGAETKDTVTTFQDAPSEPINVTTDEREKNAEYGYQCEIEWDTPLNESGIIAQYTIYYKLCALTEMDEMPEEGILDTVSEPEPIATSYTLEESAARANSRYEITITGSTKETRDEENPIKEGPHSTMVTCSTGSVVGAPEVISPPGQQQPSTANTIRVSISQPSERNGEISCYEVIVIPGGTTSTGDPNADYPADDVMQLNEDDTLPNGAYTAYIIQDTGDDFSFPDEVEIGGGHVTSCSVDTPPSSGRKKRSNIGAPKSSTYNVPLEAERNYVFFLRSFVLDAAEVWVYSSSEYSITIKTEAEPPGPNIAGIVVGIICAILAIIVIALLVVWYMRQKNENILRPNRQGIANPALDMGNDIEVQPISNNIEFDVDYPKTVVQPFPCSELPGIYYEKHNDDNRIFSSEYASLPDRPIKVSAYASKADENVNKNRYINILAYDHSRVMLKEIPNQPGTDYINACYVDGYRSPNKYIAAQGPLDNTISDFWRMVWEEKTASIVMLTNLEEKGRIKCSQYWPTRGTLDYDDITVTLDETVELSDYVIRYMTVVSNIKSDEPARRVTQLHFISWNDFDAPKYADGILQFIERVKTTNPVSAGPIIVHCSAGVGRTGTFIAIDSLIEMMAAEKRVDIFNFVCKMRENRNKIVQTEGQYVFVHMALMEHYLYGNTESEVHNIRNYWQNLNLVDEETSKLNLDLEFEKLNQITLEEITHDYANIEENKAKNRLVQVVPYDDNRVKLERQLGVEHSDYINASYIDGYYHKKAYIATQGPMLNTVNDFWRLVWESKSICIIMLTELQEKGQERCEKYWPDDSDPISYGNLAVQLKDQLQLPEYQLREFQVTDTKAREMTANLTEQLTTATGGEVRTVRQFHFHGWPEVGAPEAGVGMIDLIGQVQRHQQQNENRPVIVHCSSGAGRSGAFCVLSLVLERVKAEGFVNIFQAVKILRQQRPHMVQTVDQYQFIYKAVLEYLDSFDNYENENFHA